MGNHTSMSGVDSTKRPFPVRGQWDRYAFEMGNVLFLMLSDRNDGGPPVGRLTSGENAGGYPAGAGTLATFDWWRQQVEANQDKIIVTCHHHMLVDTTVASGKWEGVEGGFHGKYPNGAPEGTSYLYYVGGEPDTNRFERYLAANPGAIDIWLGGHTHAKPETEWGGKRHVERRWGVTFANVAPLSSYHVKYKSRPMSRVLTFDTGSATARLRCYVHQEFFGPRWRTDLAKDVPLRHRFTRLGARI